MPAKSKSPFLVYSGVEEFDLDRQLAECLAVKNRQVVLLDGQTESAEVVAECTSHSYLDEGRNRYVVVDHAEKIKKPEPLLEYITEKDPADLSTTLVAIIRPIVREGKAPEVKIPDVWAKAAEKGYSQQFPTIPPWKMKERIDRVGGEAGLLSLRLGKGVAEALIKLVGYDLYVILNELRKLKLISGGGIVSVDHVKKIVASQPPASPNDLADAAVEKDLKRAMNLLSHLWIYEGDSASVAIVGALIRNVERLLVTRSMLDAGKSADEIAAQFSMHKFRVQNTYMLWANRHTVAELTKQLAGLCQLDANVKGYSRSKRTRVELAVLSLAS